MSTITVFDNIQKNIILRLKQAEDRIRICVAWFTDEEILNVLLEQAKKGIYVEIIVLNDEFNRAKLHYFNQLTALDSKVYMVDNNEDNGMLHHKFCLIDYFILITGSYNWTNNARRNNENIIIVDRLNDEDSTTDEYNMFFKYDREFDKILVQYGIEEEIDDDTGWDLASQEINKQKKTFSDACEYFDLTMSYLKNQKNDDALESISIAISIYPHSSFYAVRHVIYKNKTKFTECTNDLFSYMNEIRGDENKEIDECKKLYEKFIQFITSTFESYKHISEINNKTRSNLGNFARLRIEPHFFTYEEIEEYPF